MLSEKKKCVVLLHDWSCRVGNLIQPIRSTTQIWVVTRHQYGIFVLVSQTSFGGETSSSVAKCRLFSQAIPTTTAKKCTKRTKLFFFLLDVLGFFVILVAVAV